MAHLRKVVMPSSKLKVGIAKILKEEGFISDIEENVDGVKKELTISLKYIDDKDPVIKGIRRISKPGLRIYAASDKLPKVMGGLGVAILSTSSGLLTDTMALKKGVGGEVLAFVW
jgi:small subunit ribosomal protein S8